MGAGHVDQAQSAHGPDASVAEPEAGAALQQPDSGWTVWRWTRTSVVSGVSQAPPTGRKRRGSQSGRLTMSSFPTSRPATVEVRRLWQPAA